MKIITILATATTFEENVLEFFIAFASLSKWPYSTIAFYYKRFDVITGPWIPGCTRAQILKCLRKTKVPQ